MYLKKNYAKLKNDIVPEIINGSNTIYYLPNEKDNGEHTLGSINIEPFLFRASISTEGVLAFLVLMKTFRTAGSKIKAQKFIGKDGELFYDISIFSYPFATISCKTRKAIKISSNFNLKKEDLGRLDKDEIVRVANFIKEHIFEKKVDDKSALALSPVDEKSDCKIWLDEGVAMNSFDTMPIRARKRKI